MCEAFGALGVETLLLHPRRRQPDARLEKQDVFSFYGVRRTFQVRGLANVDIVPMNTWLPDLFFAPLFFVHSLIWALYAALIARRSRADLYFTRETEQAFWLVLFGLPTILELHVVPGRTKRVLLGSLAERPNLRHVAVLTSFIKQRVVRVGVAEERVLVVPDAVDLEQFSRLPSRNTCRSRLGLPVDCRVVGYVGRFRTLKMEKGIPELVRALAHVNEQGGPETLLLCVGGPMDAVPEYLRIAAEAGLPPERLRFIDRVPSLEVPLWLRACDVVTIPWPWTEFSAYYTSPLKLFEYMASSTPIVASDLPALREILVHGQNALLVPPGDAAALGRTVRLLLDDPEFATRLAERAARDVRRHTWLARAETLLHAAGKNA